MCMPVIPVLQRQKQTGQWGFCWPANVVRSLDSSVGEKPCLKNNEVTKITEVTNTHTYTQPHTTQTCTHMYTHTHMKLLLDKFQCSVKENPQLSGKTVQILPFFPTMYLSEAQSFFITQNHSPKDRCRYEFQFSNTLACKNVITNKHKTPQLSSLYFIKLFFIRYLFQHIIALILFLN